MTFFVFLPAVLLSGFMFPFAGMPAFAQWLAELWQDALALLVFAAVMMTLAVSRFRKRLD